jgi:hypothetical protein
MKNARELAVCLQARFDAINEQLAAVFLSCARQDESFCAVLRLEVCAEQISHLCQVLAHATRVWADLEKAVAAHRPKTHWTILTETCLAVGRLQGRIQLLQRGLTCPCVKERRRLAAYLNQRDGEAALTRDLADRRDLAEHINEAADCFVLDGLTARALTYVFGERQELWQTFRYLIREAMTEGSNHRLIP